MSFDLTVKSDETYSRRTLKAALDLFISQMPGIKPNGSRGFVLDERPKRWMEIDLEVVSEEGENIKEDGRTYEEINCLRLHIPYAFLDDDIGRDYLPTAFAIADYIGWTLYDDQRGKPVPKNFELN
jgi:hypothetical protein